MQSIWIFKTGGTYRRWARLKGDFDDWILRGMGLADGQATVLDVTGDSRMPDPAETAGVVITGSHAMVTGRHRWSERLASWLVQAVESGTPVLGICFGHQLLAHAFGGQVAPNPNGLEFGTLPVHLKPEAARDALFGGLPELIIGHVCHTQSVVRLPAGAVHLASSRMDAHQAFRIGERAWGVQFHPEFNAESVRYYIHRYRSKLVAAGQDPHRLAETVCEHTFGQELLQRFARIVLIS